MSLFTRKNKWENFSGNINICENLEYSDILKLSEEKNLHSLQFYKFKEPNKRTWEILNEFFEKFPSIGLHIFWYDPVDFDFLNLIPSVKNFSVTSYLTNDFTPLLKITHLTSLSIGETKSTTVDLSFLQEFKKLETLYIDGMKKGLDSISELSLLKRLTLRGVKLSHIDFIKHNINMNEINLAFGSYKNLNAIGSVVNLQKLSISRSRQIPDFNFLQTAKNLISLELEGMSQMQELPDFQGLKNLKKIIIDNNSKLEDITSLSQLEALEQFIIYFPENFKASLKTDLLKQALEILLTSKKIKFTNIFHWADEKTRLRLVEKGIEPWDYKNSEINKIFERA